jgi:hypothetical protein
MKLEEEIKYSMDNDLFQILKNKIERQQEEIKYLKSQLPQYSLMNDPKLIDVESHNPIYLTLAVDVGFEYRSQDRRYHVIAKVFNKNNDDCKYFKYFVSEDAFEDTPDHKKEIILLEIHKKLIYEILDHHNLRGK